jgi:hypothetical protein
MNSSSAAIRSDFDCSCCTANGLGAGVVAYEVEDVVVVVVMEVCFSVDQCDDAGGVQNAFPPGALLTDRGNSVGSLAL